MKYVYELGEVRMIIADRHPFKGVETYFNNSVLYQDSLETGPDTEQPDFRKKADEELELDDDYPWELNLSVINQVALDVTDTTFDKGEWNLRCSHFLILFIHLLSLHCFVPRIKLGKKKSRGEGRK